MHRRPSSEIFSKRKTASRVRFCVSEPSLTTSLQGRDPHPDCPYCRNCTRIEHCALCLPWDESIWCRFVSKANVKLPRLSTSLTISVPGTDVSRSSKVPVSKTATGTPLDVVKGSSQAGVTWIHTKMIEYLSSETSYSDPESAHASEVDLGCISRSILRL